MSLGPSLNDTIGRVLRHPWVMAVKVPVREAFWSIRGRAIPPPSVPASFDSVLFVCKGNICRSPFAARLAEQLLRQSGRGHVRCASAGLTPSAQGGIVPEPARRIAWQRHQVDLDAHQTQPVHERLLQEHDVVVVMEVAQLEEVRRRFPQHAHRVVLLALLIPDTHRAASGFARFNIADPYGKGERDFLACYEIIEAAVRALLTSAADPPSPSRSSHAPR